MEYVQFLKESVIPKGDYLIPGESWNIYNSQKVRDQKFNRNVGTIQRGKSEVIKIKR